MKILRKTIMITSFLLYALGAFMGVSGEEVLSDVYVIELHGEVNDAMASYLDRELKVAQENNQVVIVDIDTYGGLVASANTISDLLLSTTVETTAFVSGKAISAGVILTISCDNVAMVPSAEIGAAETIIASSYSEAAARKALSAWKGMLSTAAIENNRPEDVILAMADPDLVLDGYCKEGELITLSSHQAVDLGVSDAICEDVDEAIEYFGLGETHQIASYNLADRVASIITSTTAMNIFFTLGFVFMILEIFSAGFGVAGVISIICFALYFFGGIIAGTAQWWSGALFVLGILALFIEMFVPGFGVFGISGLVMCLLGLAFSAKSVEDFTKLISISIVVCAVLIPISIKVFGKVKLFDKMANKEVQTVSQGYVINQFSDSIIGKVALTITDLRPIGIIELEDKRIDAFSGEGFIEKGCNVVITGKRSSSVVVRKEK